MVYHARICTDETEIDSLRGDWERCHERQPQPHIRQHPDWLNLEVESHRSEGGRPMVAALYGDGGLVGVAPFLVRRSEWPCRLGYRKILRFPMWRATFLGETLMTPEDAAAQEALFSVLARANVPFQMMFLECLPTASLLYRRLRSSAAIGEQFWVYEPSGVTPHRRLRLPASFEAYLAGFSSDSRKKIRKWVRKMDEAGEGRLNLLRITKSEQLPEFLTELEHLSKRSWQGTRLGSIIHTDGESLDRYHALAEKGWLRSYILRVGEVPIAFQIGVQADGVYYCDQTGYDPEWASHRPGTMLLYQYLRDFYAHDKPQVVDFGYGENEYKRFFGNEWYEESNVYLLRKSPYVGMALACHYGCSTAATAARRTLDEIGMREAARRRLRRRESPVSDGGAP